MITDRGIVPAKGGQCKTLSPEDLEALHSATVEILNEVGIKSLHPKARELMEANGCKVDHDREVVRRPEEVLMKFVRKAHAPAEEHPWRRYKATEVRAYREKSYPGQ